MNDATRRACLLPLAAALLLAGCGEKEQPPPPPRPVLSLVVQSQHQQSVGHFAGTIQARYETTLGFRTNGRIASRAVDVGDKVAEGALLATLDPTDQQNRLRASEGDRASAEAQWIDAQADARRQEELFTRGVGAKANLDAARTRLKTTRATLDQARAAEQQASDQLAYTRLTTDFDGVVTAWRAEAGQVVAAGQEVVTLARPEVREAVFDLPDDLAGAIPEDARFTVVAQLQGEASTTGHIREMAPQADAATRTRRVRLSLEQTPESFRLGTTVRVELSSPVAPRVSLPASVLVRAEPGAPEDRGQVWVVDENAAVVHRREVQVLRREGDRVLIGKGLADGERVVSAGVNSLKEGQAVKLDEGDRP